MTSPEGNKTGLAFRQVGPGRYEAEFEAAEVGVYALAGAFEGAHGEKGFFSQGVPLSYAPEYRDLKTNASLLDQIRERTQGRLLGVETPVYAAFPLATGVARPLWPYLLAFLLILFPIDVFIRRVAIDWGEALRKAWAAIRARLGRAATKAAPVPQTLQVLTARKQEIRAAQAKVEELAPPAAAVDLEALSTGAPEKRESARPAVAPQPPVAPAPAPQTDDYMRRLLEAKKRAKDRP